MSVEGEGRNEEKGRESRKTYDASQTITRPLQRLHNLLLRHQRLPPTRPPYPSYTLPIRLPLCTPQRLPLRTNRHRTHHLLRNLHRLRDRIPLFRSERRSRWCAASSRRTTEHRKPSQRRRPLRRPLFPLRLPLIERESANCQAGEACVRVEEGPRRSIDTPLRSRLRLSLQQRRPVLRPSVEFFVKPPEVVIFQYAVFLSSEESSARCGDEFDASGEADVGRLTTEGGEESGHSAGILRAEVGGFSALEGAVRLVEDAAEEETGLGDDGVRDGGDLLIGEGLGEAVDGREASVLQTDGEKRRTDVVATFGNPVN
jgi:hypothetical protein